MPRAPSNGCSPDAAPYRRRSDPLQGAGRTAGERPLPADSSDDEELLVRSRRGRRQILSPDTPSTSGATTPKATPPGKPNGAPSTVKSDGSGPPPSVQGSESSPVQIATPATPSKGNQPPLRTLAELGLGERDTPPCPNYSGYSTLCLKDGEIEWEKAYSLAPEHRPVIERMVSWFNSDDMTRDSISQVMRNVGLNGRALGACHGA